LSREKGKKRSFISELREEGKVDSPFLDKVSDLTIEELIAIKLECSAKMMRGKLYNFPLWYTLPYMVRDAMMNFVDRNCKTKTDMSNVLGIPYSEFIQIYRKYLE
jgi:hypothetical protein